MNAVGDTVIIGAHRNDGNGDSSGQARVFTLTDGVWVQVGADIDGENANDWSGWSVAMNAAGDTVIIGARLNDGNGDYAGQARVFTLTDGVWVQVGADIDGENADDKSGWSVAMNSSGYAVTIGAPYNAATEIVRVMPGCLGQRLNPHRLQRLGLLRRSRIRGLSPRCRAAGAPYGWGTSPVPAASPETPTAAAELRWRWGCWSCLHRHNHHDPGISCCRPDWVSAPYSYRLADAATKSGCLRACSIRYGVGDSPEGRCRCRCGLHVGDSPEGAGLGRYE